MRSVEELLEENKYIQNYIENIKNGYFNADNELANLECNWLESVDMHGDGEYVVNFGDEIIMDGMTERESENLLDYIIGILREI